MKRRQTKLGRVFIKRSFLIETLLWIGSICERVTARPGLTGVERGNQRSSMLTPEMLSDRSSSDLISQRYNHPTNRIVRYPSRAHVPRKTSQLPFVVNSPFPKLRLNPPTSAPFSTWRSMSLDRNAPSYTWNSDLNSSIQSKLQLDAYNIDKQIHFPTSNPWTKVTGIFLGLSSIKIP